jgi:hypothetical protein
MRHDYDPTSIQDPAARRATILARARAKVRPPVTVEQARAATALLAVAQRSGDPSEIEEAEAREQATWEAFDESAERPKEAA